MFIQYVKARLGLWKPEVGATYRADNNWRPDPFKPDDKPSFVTVTALQGKFVQYRWASGLLSSSTIDGFASYFFKVKQ